MIARLVIALVLVNVVAVTAFAGTGYFDFVIPWKSIVTLAVLAAVVLASRLARARA